MYNPYDDDSYSDYDDYDDSHDYDDIQQNWKKFYFSFDVGANDALSDWVSKMMDDLFKYNQNELKPPLIDGLSSISFPVNSWHPDTWKKKNFQYLGSNYQGSPIWKKQYFAVDKLNTEYILHLQAHAKHFVNQPTYYEGMFDILN